jgi:DNA-binding NtrC family response regulator
VQATILILEKNQSRIEKLRSTIAANGYTPISFKRATSFLDNIGSLAPELVILGPDSADVVFRVIHAMWLIEDRPPIVVISSRPGVVEFIGKNGYEGIQHLEEDFAANELLRGLKPVSRAQPELGSMIGAFPIIGNSPKLLGIKNSLFELARSNETVLLQGERGSGREHIARALHLCSRRRQGPFIKIDMATFDGAWPLQLPLGAVGRDGGNGGKNVSNKVGEIGSGTIFLYNIGRVKASLQHALFEIIESVSSGQSLLEDREVVDIRIIAAGGPDLDQLVEAGRLRKDLFYRINVIRMKIPPLRTRPADIPLLAYFFADMACFELGKCHFELPEESHKLLCRYHWPGNVDELKKMVVEAVRQSTPGDEIGLLDLPLCELRPRQANVGYDNIYKLAELAELKKFVRQVGSYSLKEISQEFIARAEANIVGKVLESTNWNRKKAASVLDISYKSLLSKIKAYNLA